MSKKAKGQPVKDNGFDGKAYAAGLPTRPGVYVMRDLSGKALYVGKARSLRKRVASYFDARPKIERIMRMVEQVNTIEISLTRTEGEALLLENEWIKSLKPRYNILLRDDKSYPWIVLTTDHQFPAIAFHRGARDSQRQYFGPFPSAGATRESINLIQKLFRIRNCQDSYFAHRRRPCLQYQIRRCTAPCVGYAEPQDYASQIGDARLFLQGKSRSVIERLIARMESAAEIHDYESAAMYRDQINALQQVQAQQFVSEGRGDIDFVALATEQGKACVQVVSFRGGRNLGQRAHFPTQTRGREDHEVMEAFLGLYYQQRQTPCQIVLSHDFENRSLMEEVYSESVGKRIRIQPRPRGDRRKMVQMAERNARQALQLRLASQSNIAAQYEALSEVLDLDQQPATVECIDISHTAGNQACVVFDANGPVKSLYRRYNLRNITPGDDYAAIRQVLSRRYGRAGSATEGLPELLMIDGGQGQLKQAIDVLAELGITGVPLVGIAKGAARRPGYENWVLPDGKSIQPGPESAASHLAQVIRDEAHRFAITGHKGRRQKAALKSSLEEIAGIGPKRRRALLTHFGGLQGVRKAGIEELASVPGFNEILAREVYRALH
jgi:excinuclease ABC subunit C